MIPFKDNTDDDDKDIEIDLTLDSDDEDLQSQSPTPSKKPRLEEDIKPDISKIKLEKDSTVSTSTQCQGMQTDLTTDAFVSGESAKAVEMYKRKLIMLQRKVHRLLKIIVPDVDIGNPDGVDVIVTEMIKHNQPL